MIECSTKCQSLTNTKIQKLQLNSVVIDKLKTWLVTYFWAVSRMTRVTGMTRMTLFKDGLVGWDDLDDY